MQIFLRSFYETNEENKNEHQFLNNEGQDKLLYASPIKINWLKTILVIIPLVVSLVGLFLLKYYIWFRVMMFWTYCPVDQATHLFMKDNKRQKIGRILIQNRPSLQFFHHKIKYTIIEGKKFKPVLYPFLTKFKQYNQQNYHNIGLNDRQILQSQKSYGRNEHKINATTYLHYLFDSITEPLIILQFGNCVVFILEHLKNFSIILTFMTWLSITINYLLLYQSFKHIKTIAEKQRTVKVKRNGREQKIKNIQLVPGDIYFPQDEIMCDCILLKGDLHLNEANLTGQSAPMSKSAITNIESLKSTNRWLYQGSIVVSDRQPIALVVRTGFSTRKSRVIHKIIHKTSEKPILIKSMLFFMIQCFIVVELIYFLSLEYLMKMKIHVTVVILLFFDFLAYAIPPLLNIYLNVAYSIVFVRLALKNILCTQPCKTLECSNFQTICFDKTGTLTKNEVQLVKVMAFNPLQEQQVIEYNEKSSLIYKLFACCHSVQSINDELQGDQIDRKMFMFSKFTIKKSINISVIFEAVNKRGDHLQILRVNQYEPQYRSMSVLVYDCILQSYFVYVKGAPEKIQEQCIQKVLYQDRLIEQMSLDGLRTIFFGYKEVLQKEVREYLLCDRGKFLEGIETLGMVAFENNLRDEAKSTLQEIAKVGIEPNILTGDNMFVAISTAVKVGLLSRNSPMILLEGSQQDETIRSKNGKIVATILKQDNNKITKEQLYLDEKTFIDGKYQHPIIINTDFLIIQPKPILPKGVKIFARASPENKALIIKTIKERILQDHKDKKWYQRWFGPLKQKVGMVGDGTNDLIALRQANIGFAIRDSEAIYNAAFTINNLSDICQIIRFSKCSERNVIEGYRFYAISVLIRVPMILSMIDDAAFLGNSQLIFLNLLANVSITVCVLMSCPAQNCTRDLPCSNFMGPENQLIFWGVFIIYSSAIVGGYNYHKNSDEFRASPGNDVNLQNGWNTQNQSATVNFLMLFVISIFLILPIYKSSPWKQKIWKNPWLCSILGINLILMFIVCFLTEHKILETVPIKNSKMATLLAMMVAATIVAIAYCMLIELYKFHKFSEKQPQKFQPIPNSCNRLKKYAAHNQ